MKRSVLTIGIASVVVLSFVSGVRAEGVKEGEWNMTIVTKIGGMEMDAEMAETMKEMENMPPEEKAMMEQMMGGLNFPGAGGPGITTTVTQCISKSDPIPQWETDEDCTSTHSIDGNMVKFETVCLDGTSTGEVTYQEETMNGVIKSHQTEDGEEMEITIEISGEYVGPCQQ